MIKQAIGAVLFATATHSGALSLGGPQGNAIIGRPLDLLVRSTIDADEALTGLCLEAELMYGDSRVPASTVSVSINKLGADGSGILRVKSSQPVNEPVVTLVLKAGCSSRFTRSYALLADYLPQSQSASAVTAVTRERATPHVQEVLAPGRVASTALRPAAAPASSKPVERDPVERESPIRLQPAQPRPAGVERVLAKHRPESAGPEPESSASVSTPAPRRTAAAPAESRLQLDLVALDTPASGQAKAASPAPAPQTEAPAVAAVGSDPGGGEQQRMREMVRELEGLRSEQEKMRAAVEAVNAQLAQAGAPRHLDPLVLGLLGLCGAALSALAWLWAKLRRQQLSASHPVRPD